MADISYSSQARLKEKILLTVLALLLLISVLVNGYLWKRSSQVSTQLPIDIASTSVKNAGTLYLIVGSVYKVTSQQNNAKVEIRNSEGSIIPYEFIISDASSNIFEKKGGIEEKISANSIKNGQSIELNYYLDLKTNQGQVSKVIITNN